jgi:cephalosporin hydroxylase
MLRGLHPAAIDLARIALIRESAPADLLRPAFLEDLLLRLGLNDEGLEEYPLELHPFCGHGLRVWQYPSQFSKYLAMIGSFRVRSYLELGIRHGGSFVTTVEVLERFRPLDFAVGVDIVPCPSMAEYAAINSRIEFACLNIGSTAFLELTARLHGIDLVFIDSHHEEAHCRREVAMLRDCANMIALHDVSNGGCPGISKIWQELQGSREHVCFEFTDQYPGMGPFMGIGLAVRKARLALVDAARGQAEGQ